MTTRLEPREPHRPSSDPRRPAPESASGSAYLAALLVLVVLTILGVALVTITDTERDIGANQRTVTRVFYGADAGVAIATAHALVSGDYKSHQVELHVGTETLPGSGGAELSRGFALDISHFVPILVEPCNWCPVNVNETQFFKINHAVTSTALELTWNGNATSPPADAVPQAQKTVSVMIEVQPFWQPPPDSLPTDANDRDKVKF